MKRIILSTIFVLGTLTLIACGGDTMNYYDNLGEEFNQNIYFLNDLKTPSADPSVIYIEEGEEAGYFYMYGTTDALGATGVHAYRTKNFNDWQLMGPAFIPQRDAWAIRGIWAPEVIYMNGQYYMYYSGSNQYQGNQKQMGLAISDSPAGPFVEYSGETVDGRNITHQTQPIELPWPAIDASPFVDADGQLYLYFAKDQVDGISTIWGAHMKDPVTVDEETLVQLTAPSFSTVQASEDSTLRIGDISWEHATDLQGYTMWNEGPFMYEKDGVYFLTYSANPFWAREYAVGYAVSDSPLGPFVKPENNRILGIDADWDHMSGTGHHSFFKAGSQLYMAYHAHTDRVFGNSLRALAIDEVFIEGNQIHVNGPTYSIQPLPEIMSGYRNIAVDATITATNSNDTTDKLNDHLVAMHLNDSNLEFYVENGKTTITLRFDSEVIIRSVLIYNSVDYATAIDQIKIISVGSKISARNIGFNQLYINREFPDFPEIRPGGAFILEFDEVETNQVTIEIYAGQAIAISEIVILGK